MKAAVLCVLNDQNVGVRIEGLFSNIDLLNDTVGPSVEEQRMLNQAYMGLREELALKANLTRYDLMMAQRTSRFVACPIGVSSR